MRHVFGVNHLNAIRPRSDVKPVGLTQVEQHRPGMVQQREDSQRTADGDKIEIGHAAADERMSIAKVVMDVQTRNLRGQSPARLVHSEEFGNIAVQGLRAFVRTAKRTLRHRTPQYAGSHRVTLEVVGIEKAFRLCPLHHLSQLPSQIHGVLHADIETLSTKRRMHVRGVSREQNPPVAVGRGLASHVGEP